MKIRKPNFFIVGAPKCGTTALAHYLSEHPDVFISNPKEPHFFLHPESNIRKTIDEKHYLSLFSKAGEAKRVGEASVWYLYSNYARTALKTFSPDAKIIIMKRNPVDFVASLHSQLLFAGQENEKDLATAWEANKNRTRFNDKETIELEDDWRVMYAELMLHDKYIARYIKDFGEQNVHVISQESMFKDTRKSYLDTLTFLGIDDDGRHVFPKVNINKEPRSSTFQKFLCYLGEQNWVVSPIRNIKSRLGIGTLGLYKFLQDLNVTESKRRQIPDNVRKEILSQFCDR